MFYKFDCGCVALQHHRRWYLIEACDSEGDRTDALVCSERTSRFDEFPPERFRMLTDSEADDLVFRIGRKMADGERYRTIRAALLADPSLRHRTRAEPPGASSGADRTENPDPGGKAAPGGPDASSTP